MQSVELSSNWKKLQQSLAKGRVKADDNENTGAARAKKRKLPPAAPQTNTKKQKTQASITSHKMGAYLSSFISPSTTSSSANPPSVPSPTGNNTPTANSASTQANKSTPTIGKYISLDCEMVGTTSQTPFSTLAHHHHQPPSQQDPEYSILARVSIVSYTSATVYDAYVLPQSGVPITNYRTSYSGITAQHLDPANPQTRPKPFAQVQRDVAALLQGRVLVGHALKNDLAVLRLSHPERDIRDTSRYAKFRQVAAVAGRNGKPGQGRTPSLRKLAAEVLGWDIQGAGRDAGNGGVGHDSVEDARAAMALFRKEKEGFEADAVRKFGPLARLNRRPAKVKVSEVVGEGVEFEEEELVEETPSDDDEDTGEDENGKDSALATTTKPKKKRKKKKKNSKSKR